ncbi:rhomboid family intramembrane serine protease [Chitinophaga sp. Hz27]|uniref:rhomboid family intramembrane serine protease n=1 Tax=Chitinophaga sp. Hz27 TaxID=3347169 RepID=UPI0035D7030F
MNTGIISLGLVLANIIVSWMAFRNKKFNEQYILKADKIFISRQYYRFLTAGFIHRSWSTLLLNMFTIYFFTSQTVYALPIVPFVLTYFISLLLGNIIQLFAYRKQNGLPICGAQWATAGMMLATIARVGDLPLSIFGLFNMAAWLYALIFLLIYILPLVWPKYGQYKGDIDDRYNLERADRAQIIDDILEKIQKKGINSLTTAERKALEEHSQKL